MPCRKAKDDLQIAKSSMVASLPASVTKFEQKAVINIDNADMTSLVVFHPFHDILAVSDGPGVGIWSLVTGSRIMQIPNVAPGVRPSAIRRQASPPAPPSSPAPPAPHAPTVPSAYVPPGVADGLKKGADALFVRGAAADHLHRQALHAGVMAGGRGSPGSDSPGVAPGPARVTSLLWLNESYESLLAVGSDDGTVKVCPLPTTYLQPYRGPI